MNTITGPKILSEFMATQATVLDFSTGFKKNVIVVKHNHREFVEFVIKNQQYAIFYDWKILQPQQFEPRGFILAREIIEQKLEFIYDKFNRKHSLGNIRRNFGYFGIPENFYEPFYDKLLVIQIENS